MKPEFRLDAYELMPCPVVGLDVVYFFQATEWLFVVHPWSQLMHPHVKLLLALQ